MKKILLSLILIFLIIFLSNGIDAQELIYSAKSIDSIACNEFGIEVLKTKKEAPNFTLKDLNGDKVSLEKLKGKPIFLFFWVSWCPACKEDLVLIEKFLKEKQDFINIFLIAIDGEREKKIREIIKRNNISLPVLLVFKEPIMDDYSIKGWFPQSILIDEKGLIIGKIIGQRDWSSKSAWKCLQEILFSK
jgi:peroxiredoxin